MHPLQKLWEKEERLVIGLMSGTSADGTDAALVKISGYGTSTKVQMLAFVTIPFEEKIRKIILHAAGGGDMRAEDFCRLKTLIGHLGAEACLEVCSAAGIKTSKVDLVGSHGQTVWHLPNPEEYMGRTFASTLQIGEDAVIAETMGCPVIGDFRVRDVAAGGQGAPLVPYTDFLLYRSEKDNVALQNIGGIGNVTLLPAGCRLDEVTAFDTGPGNMVMDAITSKITDGKQRYDEGGRLAAKGKVSEELLCWLLEDPYLKKSPPKTTGREAYGPEFVDKLVKRASELGVSNPDMLRTATAFTAQCIAHGIRQYAKPLPDRLVVTGGGSRNPVLMKEICAGLPECKVYTGEELGFDSDAKEAVAFAVLANEAVFASCSNVPGVTGAKHHVVMGKISI